MTTILPSARSSLDTIMDQIGSGLSQTLPQAAMQRAQRETGLGAIDQLQQQLQQAGGDVTKILPALAKAYTLNPNLERSGLGQFALEQARKNQASAPVLDAINIGNNGISSQIPMNGMASNAAQQAANISAGNKIQESEISPSRKGEGLFVSNFLPLDLGKQITPEQKTKILSDVASRNGDVEFTRKLIEDYNKGEITQNDLANSNIEKQAANVQRMLGFEDQIKQKIDGYVPADTPESEKNIYYNMLRPALEGSSTFSDAWQKVAADIDNFRKQKEALVSRIPEPQIDGISSEGEKHLRQPGMALMKKDPLAYNMIESAYTSKGHSAVTPARIYKPLPANVNKILSKAEDYRDLVYPQYSTSELTPGLMERNIETANRGQVQQIPKLANDLRKDWNEDLSLINIYADLKRKGWSLHNITSLFDDISDLFGERQQAERNMLNQNMRIPTRYLSE